MLRLSLTYFLLHLKAQLTENIFYHPSPSIHNKLQPFRANSLGESRRAERGGQGAGGRDQGAGGRDQGAGAGGAGGADGGRGGGGREKPCSTTFLVNCLSSTTMHEVRGGMV